MAVGVVEFNGKVDLLFYAVLRCDDFVHICDADLTGELFAGDRLPGVLEFFGYESHVERIHPELFPDGYEAGGPPGGEDHGPRERQSRRRFRIRFPRNEKLPEFDYEILCDFNGESGEFLSDDDSLYHVRYPVDAY